MLQAANEPLSICRLKLLVGDLRKTRGIDHRASELPQTIA
jgi:hypothetical protein